MVWKDLEYRVRESVATVAQLSGRHGPVHRSSWEEEETFSSRSAGSGSPV